MVRRHGWQYPAHTYQVVAITVFFVLSTVFYTFLSPFLGHPLIEYAASGIFSPVAFAVFFLYIRCTAIDPCDPGILSISGLRGSVKQLKPSSADDQILSIEGKKRGCLPLGLYCILGCLFKGDKCRKDGINHQSISDEDLLYCTLCNAEVYKCSKHCRTCDKCVEGFDHHCRWLNNCIGRKNYVSFVSLMATCLIMLLLEMISGLIVLIRCIADKHEVGIHLTSKLGDRFSLAPFSALVALCTLAPLLASIPLGELFFFHMLLIRKGITTYEYVIAMRARDEPQALGQESIPSQQDGAKATRWRGHSLINLPHLGSCCTPRRVEQQGEASLHLDERSLPCTVNADSTTVVERKGQKLSRNVIKISALKLALLNPKEAAQAATRARESSSVMRPVGFHSFGMSETDCGSSCNVSTPSSTSMEHGATSTQKSIGRESEHASLVASSPRQDMHEEERGMGTRRLSNSPSSAGSAPQSPSRAEQTFGNPNVLRTSVKPMHTKGLGDVRRGLQVCNTTILPRSSLEHPSWICTTPMSEGHDTSRHNQTAELGRSHIVSVNVHANGEIHGSSRMAVYWDRAAGRFRSLPDRSHCSKKVSNLLPRTASVDPHSISSPETYLVNANPASIQGPLNMSASRSSDNKENSLKCSRQSLLHNHIVLPSQSINGLATLKCSSSTSACRTLQKNLMLSRFTPS